MPNSSASRSAPSLPPALKLTAADGDSSRLGDRTYQRIKDDIICCVLAPGSSVSETQLAEQYGVGKAPIRSSLTRLRQGGLVELLARRGYLIAPISVRDVHDQYGARLVVEPQCAFL